MRSEPNKSTRERMLPIKKVEHLHHAGAPLHFNYCLLNKYIKYLMS